MSIQQNLEHILSRIRAAELRAGRPAGSVRLVAVSKTFPAEDVKACHDAGQRIFGENKVQEGLAKIPSLPPDTEWHLIGPLQRNKVRKALEYLEDPRAILRAYVGHSGWTPPQLRRELNDRAWYVSPMVPDICLETDSSKVWAMAMRRLSPLHHIMSHASAQPSLN